MKKYILILCLLLFFISNCEKEKIIPGEVGIPVYLVPQLKAGADTTGCKYKWDFVERPLNSNLNLLNFQPSSKGYNIYFTPDVQGDFKIICEVISPEKKIINKSSFTCKIKRGIVKESENPLSGTVTSVKTSLEPVYLDETKKDKPNVVKPVIIPPAKVVTKNKPKVKYKTNLQKQLYTIQISSFKTFANADKELQALNKMGLTDIFIKKTYIKSKNEEWYRIRTNSFPSRAVAAKALEKIKTKFNRKTAWIDKID